MHYGQSELVIVLKDAKRQEAVSDGLHIEDDGHHMLCLQFHHHHRGNRLNAELCESCVAARCLPYKEVGRWCLSSNKQAPAFNVGARLGFWELKKKRVVISKEEII
jgi:hypothetical protein